LRQLRMLTLRRIAARALSGAGPAAARAYDERESGDVQQARKCHKKMQNRGREEKFSAKSRLLMLVIRVLPADATQELTG